MSTLLQQRYHIQRQLGKNAGRQTLLAQDLQTGKNVVVKLLTFDQETSWEVLKLFEREAETLKSLQHPQIPHYLDFFAEENTKEKQLGLVQEYIEGTSLQAYLDAGRSFSEAEIKELVQALLKLLVDLQNYHPPVIHRDIKPSNIILSDRSGHSIGSVYLVDFGSVQSLVTQQGQTVTVVGTYGYMPPEQFGGNAVLASDLYAVGATAIALATGKHPADLPQKNLQLQFESFTEFSPAFTAWLKRMVEPSLERRFESAQAALAQINRRLDREEAIENPAKLSTGELAGLIFGQNLKMGALMGSAFGALAGTAMIPLLGTVFGGFFGCLFGMGFGKLNSYVLLLVTLASHRPLKYPQKYRQTAVWLSGIFAALLASISIFPLILIDSSGRLLTVSFLFFSCGMIAIFSLSAAMAGRKIADRYIEASTPTRR